MNPRINYNIIKYLSGSKHFVYGGEIARAVHRICGSKESIIERRCRELSVKGKLDRVYQQVKGKGHRCVMFMMNKENK